MPSPDARPLVPLPLTDCEMIAPGGLFSFRQHGQQVTVTLDESVACLSRLASAIQQTGVREKMQPSDDTEDATAWLERTPLWEHFTGLTTDQLAREVARLALLVASADALGELVAAFLASDRGVEVTFSDPEVSDAD